MITLILGCSIISASLREALPGNAKFFMESLHSDGSATYLLIIWVEKIIPLAMKSKLKPYPSIVFLSIHCS